MQIAPFPIDEAERLEKLRKYEILDTPPEEAFDRITRIVEKTIGVPIALVSLIDGERQWFKSRIGLEVQETSRDVAFCAHTILGEGIHIVEDATADLRFADNPLVTNDPSIRFYAGAPLQTPDGVKLGTLCAIDSQPRKLSEDHQKVLTDLAHIVVDELELRIALKQAMDRLAQETTARANQGDFLSAVAHEIRTPLTSICGTLGLLNGGVVGKLPAKARDLVSIADRNATSLITLVNDLLDWQKLDAGKMDFDFRPLDLEKLIEVTCENLATYACEKNVKFLIESEDVPTILGDPGRLAQALSNLISNAIKFSPVRGTIKSTLSMDNEFLCIGVSDQGPGISEDIRPFIFEKFSRKNNSENQHGAGLGLALTKAVVEAHNGKVSFTTKQGQGTTFFLRIPVLQSVLNNRISSSETSSVDKRTSCADELSRYTNM